MLPKKWTDSIAALLSFFLAVSVILAFHLLKTYGIFRSYDSLLAEISSALTIVVTILAFSGRPLHHLTWRVLNWFRRTPGNAPLQDQGTLAALRIAFAIDRRIVRDSMVPVHKARAIPARSAYEIDLGHAKLVMPATAERIMRQFVGKPADFKFPQIKDPQALQSDILVVTGEPGAGKSVMLQELHATLSSGVEEGHHSFIPLYVFARDILMEAFEPTPATQRITIRNLIDDQYAHRSAGPENAELRALSTLLRHEWDATNFLIIIDGLDEIPQRSDYEKIQRELSKLIIEDSQVERKATHRYILSCRIDEYLSLFKEACNLHLKGLTPVQRERFCKALIRESAASPDQRALIEELLASKALVPAHVFQRNPYFLTLLIEFCKASSPTPRSTHINFDFLMSRYLEREIARPFGEIRSHSSGRVEDRYRTIDELFRVARISLEWLAFHSASSLSRTALYDSMRLDAALVRAFLADFLEAPGLSKPAPLWPNLFQLLSQLTDPNRISALDAKGLEHSRALDALNENDVRLIDKLGLDLAHNCNFDASCLIEAFGTIPYQSQLEREQWYTSLGNTVFQELSHAAQSPISRLTFALFLRSIVAAHALRLLYLDLSTGGISIRFRHRRIAEYFAARHCKAHWASLAASLDASPWMGSVLNLTAAIESEECLTLAWLAHRIEEYPTPPFYLWRYSVEMAVEAAFFSHPSPGGTNAITEIIAKLLSVLCSDSYRSLDTPPVAPIDAVTKITILKAVERLGDLKDNLQHDVSLASALLDDLQHYERESQPEWIAAIVPARTAVELLTATASGKRLSFSTICKAIQHPGGIIASRSISASPALFRLRVITYSSTVIGEFLLIGFLSGLFLLVLFLAIRSITAEPATLRAAIRQSSPFVVFSILLIRLILRQQSPTSAATTAAVFWRIPTKFASLLRSLFRLQTWRKSLNRIPLSFPKVVYLLIAAVFCGALLLVVLFVGGDDVLAPCPEVDTKMRELSNSYLARIAIASPNDVTSIQQDLRKALDDFRKFNTQHCGRKINGEWVTAEDQLADSLFKEDKRLTPAANPGEAKAVGDAALQKVTRFVNDQKDPPPVIQQPFFGAIANFGQRKQLENEIDEMREIRAKLVDGRRRGIGIPVAFSGNKEPIEGDEIAAANALIGTIDQKINKEIEGKKYLDDRNDRELCNAAAWSFVVAVMSALSWYAWRALRDRQHLTEIRELSDVGQLLLYVSECSFSEMVRQAAIKRIDSIDTCDEETIETMESVVGVMMGRTSEVETHLAVEVANAVQAQSNRLRHRMS